jgi:branched-chain amino acid transport system substrate-binding protein
MKTRIRRFMIGFTVAGLLVAGLGVTAASSSASVKKASSSSVIKIGTIGTYTGGGISGTDTNRPVMKAWVTNTNKTGGLNGHKVKLIFKDDGGDATKAAAAVQELKNAGVVAIVNETSLVDVDWAKDAADAGLPVIGGSAVQIGYLLSPTFFSSTTNIFAAVYADMVLGKEYGPNIAIIPCAEAPTCAQSVAIYKAFAGGLDMDVVYSQTVSASAPDFTAVCQALKDSGAQSYVIVNSTAGVARISNACVTQGVTAKLIESSGAVGPELLKAKGAQGLLSADVDFPFVIKNTPATKEFHKVIAKYAPNLKNEPATNVPWTAMQLFGAAVKGVGTAAVTTDSLEQALYAMQDETLGGLAPPLTFTEGEVSLHNCWFVLGIKNQKFTAPKGGDPQCSPDDVINPLAKAAIGALTGG